MCEWTGEHVGLDNHCEESRLCEKLESSILTTDSWPEGNHERAMAPLPYLPIAPKTSFFVLTWLVGLKDSLEKET